MSKSEGKLIQYMFAEKYPIPIPIGYMYGIYANILGILMVSIHGSYGLSLRLNMDPVGDLPLESRQPVGSNQ